MDSLIAKLYRSPKTILTNKDLALIWQKNKQPDLKNKIAYYVKQKTLIRLTRGVFTKDKNYHPQELATRIYAPSYISFETVLREAGIIFQHDSAIFVASKWPQKIKIDKHRFIFRKLKNSVLFNPTGVTNRNGYSIATPERAFLDMIYLFPNYYFDNLEPINWEKCDQMAKIYHNQQLLKRLNKYRQKYAQS